MKDQKDPYDLNYTNDWEPSEDEEKLLDELGIRGIDRRKFLGQGIAGGLGIFALQLLAKEKALASLPVSTEAVVASTPSIENAVKVVLKINGSTQSLNVDSRTVLLDALRERLALTGTKKGCDHGQCGACTVLLNGESVKSCTLLGVQADGTELTTIEGLADNGVLHPVQQAFHEQHGLQCGYCTPGMVMATVSLLAENSDPSEDEIRHALEGNLCRCTGYQNIVKAVRAAADQLNAQKEAAE